MLPSSTNLSLRLLSLNFCLLFEFHPILTSGHGAVSALNSPTSTGHKNSIAFLANSSEPLISDSPPVGEISDMSTSNLQSAESSGSHSSSSSNLNTTLTPAAPSPGTSSNSDCVLHYSKKALYFGATVTYRLTSAVCQVTVVPLLKMILPKMLLPKQEEDDPFGGDDEDEWVDLGDEEDLKKYNLKKE